MRHQVWWSKEVGVALCGGARKWVWHCGVARKWVGHCVMEQGSGCDIV